MNQQATTRFFKFVHNPVGFRLFLLRKLPAAFFSGLRVVMATEPICAVSVPYKWLTQNPFRSTYFASLAMAAEMSTGILAMAHIHGRKPKMSMLVTGMDSRYYKKATGITIFTCKDGILLQHAVTQAAATGAPQTARVFSEGRNKAGDLVAEFWFEWSFRQKT